MSDLFLLIYLDETDIQDLGGWPISRDYYGYMTHALFQGGARVIAFDLLLDQPDHHYPETDTLLADFFESAGVVCLPMIYNTWDETEIQHDSISLTPKIPFAADPIMPYTLFKKRVSRIGFGNFGHVGTIQKVPLLTRTYSDIHFSFGLEMSRVYLGNDAKIEINQNKLTIRNASQTIDIPVDDHGRLHLNYYGKMDHIRSIGFVNFLKAYEAAADSIPVRDKIVLIAVTAPSLPVLKSTPISSVYPASLIHATAAMNILSQDFLVSMPQWISCVLFMFIIAAITFLFNLISRKRAALFSLSIFVIFFCVSYFCFKTYYLVLPIFSIFFGLITTTFYWFFIQHHQGYRLLLVEQKLLKDAIMKKEIQLEEAGTKLNSLESQIQKELKEKETLSETSRKLIEEKEAAVLEVEKQIRDLEAYQSRSFIRKTKHGEIIHTEQGKLSQILDLIDKMKSDDIAVLISGETGTGKELIARAVHNSSPRKKSPFVAINCSALPDTLLESELFGHEKGSFTGAYKLRKGRFELANGGTIFLDEITETSPAFQSRLLRVLQEKTLERIGSEKTITVDVRIIAATHKDIQEEVKEGRFRKDLFYRLNGFPLTLPTLQERAEDIPLLCQHFLEKHKYSTVVSASDRVVEILIKYRWPGNVRELENVIRRAAILAQSEKRTMIQEKDLPPEIIHDRSISIPQSVYQSIEEQILSLLRKLQFSRSSIQKTAEAMGNRDRGTITEYFRGICFQHFVACDFNIHDAATTIADSADEKIIRRVESKVVHYLENLKTHTKGTSSGQEEDSSMPIFKGLPKKYHTALRTIIEKYQ